MPPRPVDGPPSYVPEPEPEGLTLRDYIAVMWRRKWIILVVVVVAAASAYYFSYRQPKQYEAKASLIYEQGLDLANPLTGQGAINPAAVDREIAGISDVMTSPDMRARAAKALKGEAIGSPADFTVSASPQKTNTSSTTTASNVVVVSAQSASARLSAAVADAYAQTFVEWSKERKKLLIDKAATVTKGQLAEYKGAAKETGDYFLLKQRLQDLQILSATATGNYRVLRPASVPAAPFAPNPLRSAILGFGVGLFAGIGLAFLLEQFDTGVRRPDEIAAILRRPILGSIPKIHGKLLDESSLVTLKHPEGNVAEAFRMVRTNLDFMAVDNEIRSLAITSCIKSEGKSVSLANLAITMALAGKKVVVVDADLRRPRQHKFFEIENEAGVSTVATGRAKLFDALVPIEVQRSAGAEGDEDFAAWVRGADAQSRLYVLPSGPIPPNPGEIVASRRFAAIIEELEQEADLVLIDTPAMLAVGDASVIAAVVDGLVFLVDMHVVTKPQLMTAADQLMRLPTKMLGVVVRMHVAKGSYYYSPYYYRYTYAEDGSKTKHRRRRSTDRAPGADLPVAAAAASAGETAPPSAPAVGAAPSPDDQSLRG